MLVAPAGALAADPPTILSAGINSADQLYATWSVAPGTTFDFVTFATVPDPDPTDTTFFARDNFAGFCDPSIASPTCTATSYKAQYPLARDRRYFVKVSAKVSEGTWLSSAIWVIDDAKPQIGGDAPLGSIPPTNKPVAGHPLGTAPPPPPVGPPPPPAATPTATIKLLSPPKTFGALLLKGARLKVTCTATCAAFGRLTLAGLSIGSKPLEMTGGGTRTLTIKPSSKARKRLRGRSRATIRVIAAVVPAGGTTRTLIKSFKVHR